MEDLIKEISPQELYKLIGSDDEFSIVNTYTRDNESRAVYRVNNQLYDSTHLFSPKVSEIDSNGLKFISLEPNRDYDKFEDISKALTDAMEKTTSLPNSIDAVSALARLWNTFAEDYVLVRKTDLQEVETYDIESKLILEAKEDKNLMDWYWKGWENGNPNINKPVSENPIENKAFNLGALDFVAGDDAPSIDRKSQEEILQQIRNED